MDFLKSEVECLMGECDRCYVEINLEVLRGVRDGAISLEEVLEEFAKLEKTIPPY